MPSVTGLAQVALYDILLKAEQMSLWYFSLSLSLSVPLIWID